MSTILSSTFREIRCACHRLLLKISSTSQARVEAKCPRCGDTTVFLARRVVVDDGDG